MITQVSANLTRIKSAISDLLSSKSLTQPVTLIAVSKLQPIELIQQAYNSGHRDFGENYVDELLSKSHLLPNDINWHMIGHVQTNKISKLLSIENLKAIHTIDSLSLALKIDQKLAKKCRNLSYFVQINTSGESSKSGVSPKESQKLALEIIEKCPSLNFKGFMTIGEKGNQEDFKILQSCRADFSLVYPEVVELSMGMSSDYKEALLFGSNYIRVGTSVFGLRKTGN